MIAPRTGGGELRSLPGVVVIDFGNGNMKPLYQLRLDRLEILAFGLRERLSGKWSSAEMMPT
jgi:hypothetical protein